MKPETITIFANGKAEQVASSCPLDSFLSERGWKGSQVVVEHNGRVLPRAELAQIILKDGDSLEVIVPVAGG